MKVFCNISGLIDFFCAQVVSSCVAMLRLISRSGCGPAETHLLRVDSEGRFSPF